MKLKKDELFEIYQDIDTSSRFSKEATYDSIDSIMEKLLGIEKFSKHDQYYYNTRELQMILGVLRILIRMIKKEE